MLLPEVHIAGVTHICELLSMEHSPQRSLNAVLPMQVTSYLMMGALSPGLKRHSVTLFEGENFCCCCSLRCESLEGQKAAYDCISKP